MKVVILAGGLGTRLSEETEVRPKPLVEIGGHPIIWHIMKHYVRHGFNEFVVALGYKGEEIKRYFLDYHRLRANLTVDLASGQPSFHEAADEPWTVHLIDTGLKTNTGARVKRLQPWLEGETFMLTYGDGVCSIDLQELLRFHRKQGRLATVTAVRRFQRRSGLPVDGIAGPRTRAALGRRGRPAYGSRTMRRGDRGWDVAALQFIVHDLVDEFLAVV